MGTPHPEQVFQLKLDHSNRLMRSSPAQMPEHRNRKRLAFFGSIDSFRRLPRNKIDVFNKHTHPHTRTHVHAHKRKRMHTRTRTHTHTHAQTHTHIHTTPHTPTTPHTDTHTRAHKPIHVTASPCKHPINTRKQRFFFKSSCSYSQYKTRQLCMRTQHCRWKYFKGKVSATE